MNSADILAYSFDCEVYCLDCLKANHIDPDTVCNARGEGAHPIFVDNTGDYEDGLYCGRCYSAIWLPADLETIPDDELTIYTPDADALPFMAEWHGGQSSYMYAVSSTGAFTMALCPHTYRQAYAMLTDLLREVEDVQIIAGLSVMTAREYVLCDTIASAIRDARRDYRR